MSITPFGRRYEPAYPRVWDPYHDPEDYRAALTTPHMAFPHETPSIVSTQIEETPEAHLYKAHLPGLKHNEVRVEVDDDRVLCISGEKRIEKEEKVGRYHRVERSGRQFVQQFRLPENAMVDHVKARIDNGVLTVTVPKHQVGHHHASCQNHQRFRLSGH